MNDDIDNTDKIESELDDVYNRFPQLLSSLVAYDRQLRRQELKKARKKALSKKNRDKEDKAIREELYREIEKEDESYTSEVRERLVGNDQKFRDDDKDFADDYVKQQGF